MCKSATYWVIAKYQVTVIAPVNKLIAVLTSVELGLSLEKCKT